MTKHFKKLNSWLNKHELILIFLLINLLLRLPTLFEPLWYGDENIYLAIGQGMRKGLILYQDITDYPNKPPLIYILAALVKGVFGFRLLLIFWHSIGTIIFYQLAQRFTQKQYLPEFITFLFLFLTSTPIIEGTIANAEIFFITPTMLSLWFLTYSSSTKPTSITKKTLFHFLAGLSIGFSFLFKIHVLFDIIALGFFFYIYTKKFNFHLPLKIIKDTQMWLFGIGVFIPISITLAIWYFLGVPPQNLLFNAAGSSGYVSAWQGKELILQTIGFGSLHSRLILLLIITFILYLLKNKLTPKTAFLSLWLVFSLFAALLSARPYPHYLIQVVPPLCLSILVFFSSQKKINNITLLSFYFLLILAFIRFDFKFWSIKSYYANFSQYISGQIDRQEYYRRLDWRMPRNYLLAQKINQLTNPQDRIYIWGTESGVYVLADRLPIEKLVVSFHVEDLNYYQQTVQAIDDQLPPIIVVMETESRRFDQLQSILAKKYALIEKVGDPGKSDSYNKNSHALIYKRIDFKLPPSAALQ